MNKLGNLMLMERLCMMKEMTENKWMIMLAGMGTGKSSRPQSSEIMLLVGDKGLFFFTEFYFLLFITYSIHKIEWK